MVSVCKQMRDKLVLLEMKLTEYEVLCLGKSNKDLIDDIHGLLSDIIIAMGIMEERKINK